MSKKSELAVNFDNINSIEKFETINGQKWLRINFRDGSRQEVEKDAESTELFDAFKLAREK